MPEQQRPAPRGPLDALKVPRFAGPATFARLPTLELLGLIALGQAAGSPRTS